MTPKTLSLIQTAKRFGLSGTLVVAFAGAGFRAYDKTNASSVRVEAIRDSIVARRTLDSLRTQFEYRDLTRLILRTDSAVQKMCVRMKAC